MHRAFIIAGPTGTGKSEIAIRVAVLLGAEIVGADAMQVYRGMGVVTAAPDASQLSVVPHHCVGVLHPAESCDVVKYCEMARLALDEIRSRGRTALVVGGTGLYLRALTRGLAPAPGPDAGLRNSLSALPIHALQRRLQELDPEALARIDARNPRRLIRAIEKALAGTAELGRGVEAIVPPHGVLLVRSRPELLRRIDDRARWMVESGAIDEVAAIARFSDTAAKAIGVAEIREYLNGRLAREELINRIVVATRQYARRQMTWFRREPWLVPIDLDDLTVEKASEQIAGRAQQPPLRKPAQ